MIRGNRVTRRLILGLLICAGGSAALLLAERPCRAEVIRVDFSGVTTTFDFTPVGPHPTPGTRFSGYYLYDTSTPAADTTATQATYLTSAPYGLFVTEGNFVFESSAVPNSTTIAVRENPSVDRFFVDSISHLEDLDGNQVYPYAEAFFGLVDPSRTSLTGLGLPTTPFDLSNPSVQIEFFLAAGPDESSVVNGIAGFGLNGVVDRLTLSVVPEPSSVVLLGCGILALSGYARNRWRRSRAS